MLLLTIDLPGIIEYAIKVSIPLAGAYLGVVKYLETDKEKHRAQVEADAEKDKRRIEADVEKEKVKADAEVSKIRGSSLGGEAVAKIWKEVTNIQVEIKRLADAQDDDHSNDMLVKEIIKRLQEDVNRLMTAFFDKLINR